MEKYKIVKKIASGSEGTVFKAKYKNKTYALKITNILKKDAKKSLASPTWREIYFATIMSKKYPNHFMKLYDHDIVSNCNKQYFKMNIDDIDLSPRLRKKYVNLVNSGFCSVNVYTYVDFTLSEMINKLSKKQLHSGIIQIAYIIYVTRKEGYINYDSGPHNIGLMKTDEKYIKIFDYDVPTFGYIYVALDYGRVYGKNFIYTKQELKYLKNFELTDTFSLKFITRLEYKLKNDIEFINKNINSPKKIIDFLMKKYFTAVQRWNK